MWNDCNCCCDGKTVRELKKKVDKAVYSIGLNGDILYPTDGTGNLNLGDIGGSYDARDILLPDGSDVAENIEDLQTGKVDAVSPVNIDNGINLNVTKNGDTTQTKIAKGSDSVTISEGTIQIADAVKQTIENASATATEADAKADDAQADATDALTKANNAVKSASSGIYGGDANKLALTLETNQGTKVNVPLIADSADIDMSEHTAGYWILKLKDAVKNKLDAAYKAISTSVVDKALEATVETNDGSTATIPLFEIGDGLEWVEKTLKATGSSSPGAVSSFEFKTLSELLTTNGVYAITVNSNINGLFTYIPIKPSAINIESTSYGYKLNITSSESEHVCLYANMIATKTDDNTSLVGYCSANTSATATVPLTVDGETSDVTITYTHELTGVIVFTSLTSGTVYYSAKTTVYYEGLIGTSYRNSQRYAPFNYSYGSIMKLS